jgi:hypothetical protein
VPLRPVSELGLVDLTELGPREHSRTAGRRPPARAPKAEPESARRRPTKKQNSATRGGSAARSGASSKRARSGSPKKSSSRSGNSPNGSSTQAASRSGRLHDKGKGSFAAKLGISAVTGGIALAGAVLLGRAAFRR